jgi:hypothetical protein
MVGTEKYIVAVRSLEMLATGVFFQASQLPVHFLSDLFRNRSQIEIAQGA